MSRLAGIIEIAGGAVYLLIGAAALVEIMAAGRRVGSPRFGLSLAGLAIAGGSQGVLHGVDVIGGATNNDGALLAAALLGLGPAAVFCWLRYEAYRDRAGDRIIHGSPSWVPLLPAAFAFVAGAILVISWSNREPLTVFALPAALVAAILLLVGRYLLRAQQVRHSVAGGWSVSGLAVTLMFPTWAVIFTTQILVGEIAGLIQVANWLSVPAAAWFLVECRRLVAGAERAGPRTTLAVSALRARRPAPWAKPGLF